MKNLREMENLKDAGNRKFENIGVFGKIEENKKLLLKIFFREI